jgi:hypothetical protein
VQVTGEKCKLKRVDLASDTVIDEVDDEFFLWNQTKNPPVLAVQLLYQKEN